MEFLVSDNGLEYLDLFSVLLKQHKVWHICILPYNSQVNGFVEVVHKAFIQGLWKLTGGFT